MKDNANIKAIPLQGIVRNATKIGVQDGQAEDLINLRFMDGSWRASGDGRLINFTMNRTYTQLYVHTNVYHHLLGVYEGTLYWFAEIANDGVSFYALQADKTGYPEDMQDLPSAPVALTTVVGDMWIAQTGHLLTIIDENDDFEYYLFKRGTNTYKGVELDVNGTPSDRNLFPFGHIYFNLHNDESAYESEEFDIVGNNDSETAGICNEERLVIQRKVQKKNKFSRPFLVIGAVELYDGSYLYATPPQLMFPMQNAAPYYKNYYNKINAGSGEGAPNKITGVSISDVYPVPNGYYIVGHQSVASFNTPQYTASGRAAEEKMTGQVIAFDLVCSVENVDTFLKNNKDIFRSFCIFITPEQEIYKNEAGSIYGISSGGAYPVNERIYIPNAYPVGEVKYNLLHNNFYLLKKYTASTIHELSDNNIVDLSHVEDKEIVDIIDIGEGHRMLDIEAAARQSFIPKVTYYYNNKLHIANYKARQFDGYPIDLFFLNNDSVKHTDTRVTDYINEVIPKVKSDFSYALQWSKNRYDFISPDLATPINYGTQETGPDWHTAYSDGISDAVSRINAKGDVVLFLTVEIDTDEGIQKVSRFLRAFDTTTAQDWLPRYIEDLSPILSFPDTRAYKMTIGFMQLSSSGGGHAKLYTKDFSLSPHPYLNYACFVTDNLEPIKISSFTQHSVNINHDTELNGTEDIIIDDENQILWGALKIYIKGVAGVDYYIEDYGPWDAPENQLDTEYFPNGLKVAKTENPLFFPVENTYRVGSSEILALMSNTIAVGTGQTGAAPLYVFCKDGVYALFVDASGEMTYPNARVLARDVCNNPRSVTPIDAGVVFTTDRGLMMMAGEQVEEIGQPAEGDVLQYAVALSPDKITMANGALRKVAELPSVVTSTDFLTYLKDTGTTGKAAIINYNHNLRELIVSNPNYSYSYVMNRLGQWSRRDYTAIEYINNYPTSYRLTESGAFFKLDEEGDDNTLLEQRKEAANKFFYLSNVIKLDSIGFKQALRFVVRGYFETDQFAEANLRETAQSPLIKVYITGNAIDAMTIGQTKNIWLDNRYGDKYWVEGHGADSHTFAHDDIRIFKETGEEITFTVTEYFSYEHTLEITKVNKHIGCYVFGSYDGRKWAMLGGNEKQGKFTDIGCKIERTDVKFFRICLAGQITGKSRIDYTEISSAPSILNTKIR